ncbi:hypothetical protein DID80_03315 [Candidatus Marinamargulisbacteria bacterium SCGC AAA071-K20]|nr:hypothetical protein DID80_03315 [Candidatus Marinamargulisbacteria bacterium SCGC AAA071-K20]
MKNLLQFLMFNAGKKSLRIIKTPVSNIISMGLSTVKFVTGPWISRTYNTMQCFNGGANQNFGIGSALVYCALGQLTKQPKDYAAPLRQNQCPATPPSWVY